MFSFLRLLASVLALQWLASVVALSPALAATSNREESIRAARVWQKPSWINARFEFDAGLNVFEGPEVANKDQALTRPVVACQMTAETAVHDSNGDTRKFYCMVTGPDGKAREVKFKYFFEAGEIPAEVMGTRLLWALGFAADRMFFIEQIDCYGCAEDPFFDRRVDSKTLASPRRFSMVAAERKYPGKEIDGGFSFDELMRLMPASGPDLERESTEREALRLLSVFLRYADNKADNQRIVCEGRKTTSGGCSGPTKLMLHDLGVSFARGLIPGGPMTNVDFPEWDQSPIWADPAKCLAALGENDGGESPTPAVHENGRVFLVKLLRGFSNGTEGRRRVEDIFRAGHADLRGGTNAQWADVFIRKVNELEFPMGKAQRGFRCPQ